MRVLITGANRGIGRALYDGYVARGDDVIATTRNQASDGWLQLDVTDPASVSAMANQLKGEAIDLLICNAGVYLDKGNELGNGYTSNVWADTFAANVTGVFLTIEALLSNLRAVGGKVAIISSQMGSSERAGGNAFAYRASKAAALNLGRNLAVELSPDVAVGISIRAGCKPIWEVRRLTSQWTSRPPDCCGASICLGQTPLAALRCGTARRCPTDTPCFQTKGTVRAKLVEAGRATP